LDQRPPTSNPDRPSRRRFACLPGSAWENGYIESFNARFRDELLNGEIFYTLKEAKIVIEEWRKHYNTVRPHSALGYRPPAPESIVPLDQKPIMH
jgi:putative transposase